MSHFAEVTCNFWSIDISCHKDHGLSVTVMLQSPQKLSFNVPPIIVEYNNIYAGFSQNKLLISFFIERNSASK